MARSPWTDVESERLKVLHAEGKSLHAISKELTRSKETVSRHAARLGLDWDRERTAKAAEAVHVDNKARRATLESRLLSESERMLDQLHEPCKVFAFGGKDNEYNEHELDRPDFNGQKSIIQSVSTAMTTANRLHDLNSDGRDLPAVDAWLEAMTSGDAVE